MNDTALIESEEKITKFGLKNSSCHLWEPKTILIALYASPTVGRLGILEVNGTANQACSALVAKPDFGYLFLYYTLFFGRQDFNRIAVGAAQQNISQEIVRNFSISIPPIEYLRKFNETIEPLYSKQVTNLEEIRTLANLRNTLLPWLMKGDLQIDSF